MHRAIHGRSDGRCTAASRCRSPGAVRCIGAGAGLAIPCTRHHSAFAPPLAPTRAMDGNLPPLDGAANGANRCGADLAGQPGRRQWLCFCCPAAGGDRDRSAGAARSAPAPWPGRGRAVVGDAGRSAGFWCGGPARHGSRGHKRGQFGPPQRAVQRSGIGQGPRQWQAGVRLSDRRLVPDLQSQRRRCNRA